MLILSEKVVEVIFDDFWWFPNIVSFFSFYTSYSSKETVETPPQWTLLQYFKNMDFRKHRKHTEGPQFIKCRYVVRPRFWRMDLCLNLTTGGVRFSKTLIVFPAVPQKGNPTMTTRTVMVRRKRDPPRMLWGNKNEHLDIHFGSCSREVDVQIIYCFFVFQCSLVVPSLVVP